MKITPIDVRKKKFKKSFRGYDCEEVSAFLSSLSREWERLQAECRLLREEKTKTKKDLEKLKEVEGTMFKALKNAESAGTDVVRKAHQTADFQMRETKIKAEALLQRARERSGKIVEETKKESYRILQNLQQEIRSILYTYESVKEEKESLVRNVQTLVEGVLKKTGVLSEKVKTSRLQEKAATASAFQVRLEDSIDALQEEINNASFQSSAPSGGAEKKGLSDRTGSFFDDL